MVAEAVNLFSAAVEGDKPLVKAFKSAYKPLSRPLAKAFKSAYKPLSRPLALSIFLLRHNKNISKIYTLYTNVHPEIRLSLFVCGNRHRYRQLF